jgi:hypothetical protein
MAEARRETSVGDDGLSTAENRLCVAEITAQSAER